MPWKNSSTSSQHPNHPKRLALAAILGLPRRLKKPNADQKRELTSAYCDGATICELAERFGIDRKTVSRILYRQDVPTRERGLSPAQAERAAHLRASIVDSKS